MIKQTLLAIALITLIVLGVAACAKPTPTPPPPPPAPAAAASDADLALTGKVSKEMSWSEDELRAMEQIDAVTKNKEGQDNTYTGVSIVALLELAGVLDGATTIIMLADDGYSVDVPLADVQACDTCVVAFRNNGGLRTAMPGMVSNTNVKGIVEIQVE